MSSLFLETIIGSHNELEHLSMLVIDLIDYIVCNRILMFYGCRKLCFNGIYKLVFSIIEMRLQTKNFKSYSHLQRGGKIKSKEMSISLLCSCYVASTRL